MIRCASLMLSMSLLWACAPEPANAPDAKSETLSREDAAGPSAADTIIIETGVRQDTPPAPDATAPVAPSPRPSPAAPTSKLKFETRRCMNMGNALEAEYEGAWGYTIAYEDIRAIARAGFDTVRIPVAWSEHTELSAPYTIDPAFMARVNEVTRQAQSLGLKVIIDVHHYREFMTAPDRHQPRLEAIWRQIADNYAGAPDTIYFELLNEPVGNLDSQRLYEVYTALLRIIREKHPTRPVIIGGGNWNSADGLVRQKWPNDQYLVATFHDYDPHAFTHQGAEWEDRPNPIGRRYNPRNDHSLAAQAYRDAGTWARKKGVPVFIGEFGVIDHAQGPDRVAWSKARRLQIEAAGMTWCYWDFAGRFPAFDLQTRQMLPGMRDALLE